MKSKKILKPARGNILIANPFIRTTEEFEKSTIILTDHNMYGSAGLMFNKKTGDAVDTLFEDFPPCNFPLFYGGEDDQHVLSYVHTLGNQLEGSEEIINGVYLGGDFEHLQFLIDREEVSQNQIKFIVGKTYWRPNDLMIEIKRGDWIVAQCTPEDLLCTSQKSHIIYHTAIKNGLGAIGAAISNKGRFSCTN